MQLRFGTRWQQPLRSLYLGGGTPSHLGSEGIERLLDGLRAVLDIENAEVTLETNPEDVNAAAVAAWRAAGVNRISIGIQTFNDDALQWMHRVHDGARALAALHMVRDAFERVSVDLIFALPDTVPRRLAEDVSQILAARVGHVSIYGLTAEPKTPYARWLDRGQAIEAGEERYETEFLQLHELLTAAGLEHYEVSSFAAPGHRSIHNSAYWSGASYAGVGPAAHGFDGTTRRWNVAAYEEWRKRVEAGQDPLADEEQLTGENRVAESVYLGLRVEAGLTIAEKEIDMVSRWTHAGWGTLHKDKFALSALGWLRLDSLAAALTVARSR
jgi:oxygen-independent coproporphyrinogen III oxidase